MTVSTTTIKSPFYDGDGVTEDFAFNFNATKASEVKACILEGDSRVVLTQGTDYTVVFDSEEENGTVTLLDPTILPAGKRLLIYRETEPTQEASLVSLGRFSPEIHEKAFDRAVQAVQELLDLKERALISPFPEEKDLALPVASSRENKVLGFDSDGNIQLLAQETIPGTTESENVSFTQDSVNAPIIVDANAIFRRKLHIMDFVPKSEWANIENQDTASQDSAVVTAGVLNALREMKARKTELDCGYGRFLVEGMALSSATDCLIYGGEFELDYQAYGANTHIFDLQNSCSDVFFDKVHFVGTGDSSATYDATNRYGGIEVNDSAHIVVERSKFSKFTSYGVFGKNLTGGTFTEGLLIDRCRFLDFPYDSGTPFQAGVILGDDGEYTTVTNSRFYRVPSAARFTDGANSIFSHNIAMDLNGGYGTDRAAFYSEQGTNSGKLQVTHNKFNHIETGQIVVFMKNDPTKPQNIQILESNELLVNGSVTHSQQVVLNDCPNAKVLNNNIRPNNVVAGEQCLRLNDCDGATVENNHFDGGDYSITIDNGTINLGHNTYDSPTTGKINLRGTGAFKVTTGRSYSIRVAGSGSAGTPNDKAWTSSKIATGHYQITHNIGDTNYSASIEIDNSATAPYRTSVVRGANTLDVYIVDSAGTLTDSAHLVNITVGINNEYAL